MVPALTLFRLSVEIALFPSSIFVQFTTPISLVDFCAATMYKARDNLRKEQQASEVKGQEFQISLSKAREEASASRAKVAALQRQLERADVPGLQVMLVVGIQ